MSLRRVALYLAVGAVIGVAIFGVMVYRTSTVEHVELPAALRRFSAVRSALGPGEPLLTLDDEGRVIRRRDAAETAPATQLSRLKMYAYQSGEQRLVASDIPFWFFKLKGPAASVALSGSGLDFERLRITAADLERHGPAVVIDHARANGDRLLVWTE